MSDELMNRLARPNRRSFLRGSALLAAAALMPAELYAQQSDHQTGQTDQDGQTPGQGRDSVDGQERREGPEKHEGQDAKDPDKNDAPAQKAKEGDGAETFIGADGRPYRICPQCGANMYKQNRTWTCENCGYSYEE